MDNTINTNITNTIIEQESGLVPLEKLFQRRFKPTYWVTQSNPEGWRKYRASSYRCIDSSEEFSLDEDDLFADGQAVKLNLLSIPTFKLSDDFYNAAFKVARMLRILFRNKTKSARSAHWSARWFAQTMGDWYELQHPEADEVEAVWMFIDPSQDEIIRQAHTVNLDWPANTLIQLSRLTDIFAKEGGDVKWFEIYTGLLDVVDAITERDVVEEEEHSFEEHFEGGACYD